MGKRSRDEDTVIVLATQLEAAADDISQSVNGDHKRILQAGHFFSKIESVCQIVILTIDHSLLPSKMVYVYGRQV
jgi:hypothetical protein